MDTQPTSTTALQWRFRARAVAICDLVLSSLAIICVLGVPVVLVFHMRIKLVWHVWVVLAFLFIVGVVDLCAAIILLMSTDRKADPKLSLRRAVIWRNVSILSFAITSVCCIILMVRVLPAVFKILYNSVAFYTICKYIKELESKAAEELPPVLSSPDAVVLTID